MISLKIKKIFKKLFRVGPLFVGSVGLRKHIFFSSQPKIRRSMVGRDNTFNVFHQHKLARIKRILIFTHLGELLSSCVECAGDG